MDAMAGPHPPPGISASTTAAGDANMHPHKMMKMMHMTFFWGKNAEILFAGWPGHDRPGMYGLALLVVFLLAAAVEGLSHSRLITPGPAHLPAGLAQTALHMVRVALAYMVMLAVMSFNVGVFLAAVAGHAIGFMVLGSRLLRASAAGDGCLPPLKC